MEHIVPTFEFGGHTVDVVVKDLPQIIEYNLENIGGASGSSKIVVLRQGVKSVKIDGQNKPLYRRDEDGDQVFTIPNIRDKETRKSLAEELLVHVVGKNDFLGFDDRFKDIFGKYLPADEQDIENPTDEAGSSTAMPTPPDSGQTPQT